MDTKKLSLAIKIFGITLIVCCAGAIVWSLFRPPVTTGPMPGYPNESPGIPLPQPLP